jgi:hypothetical protein
VTRLTNQPCAQLRKGGYGLRMAKGTIGFVVIEHRSDGPRGMGPKYFHVPPRVGEFFTENDENHIGQAYRVLRVIHSVDEHTEAGDLIVEHVGTSLDLDSGKIK